MLCGAEWQNSIHHALRNNKLICNPAKNKNHESNLDRGLRQQLSSKFLTKSKRQKILQKIVLTLYRTETGSDFELYSEKKLFNEIFVLLQTFPNTRMRRDSSDHNLPVIVVTLLASLICESNV